MGRYTHTASAQGQEETCTQRPNRNTAPSWQLSSIKSADKRDWILTWPFPRFGPKRKREGKRRWYRGTFLHSPLSPPPTWSSPGLGGKWLRAHRHPLGPREGAHGCGWGCHCCCRCRCCCRRCRHWTDLTCHWTDLTCTCRVRNTTRSQRDLNGKSLAPDALPWDTAVAHSLFS